MILLISSFIAISLLTETIGVFFRLVGSLNNLPTLGYSIHVRVATLGRFFTFLSAPALGYIVDSGSSSKDIALIGALTFLFVSFFGWLFTLKGASIINLGYLKFTNSKNFIKFQKINITHKLISKNLNFIFIVAISFLTTAIGVILVNYLATIFVEFRATIVQTTALITALGTLIHVFIVDPKLAKAGDENPILLNSLVHGFVIARVMISLLLSVIFTFIYLS